MSKILRGLLLLVVLAIGYSIAAINYAVNSNYITVRVMDSTGCNPSKISFVLESKTISISGNQIQKDAEFENARVDTLINILAPESDMFEYYLKIDFESCPSVETEPRVVKTGYILYEWINNSGVRHEIRAY